MSLHQASSTVSNPTPLAMIDRFEMRIIYDLAADAATAGGPYVKELCDDQPAESPIRFHLD